MQQLESFPSALLREADRGFLRKVVHAMDAFRQFGLEEIDHCRDRGTDAVLHTATECFSAAGKMLGKDLAKKATRRR